MEEGQKFGIGLMPDDRTRECVKELNALLQKQYGVSYLMDSIQGRPHLTLLQTKFTSQQELEQILTMIVEEGIAPIEIRNTSLELAFERFVFLACERTDSLQAIHERVIERCLPIIVTSGQSISASQQLRGLTPEEMTNIERYGFPYAGSSFRPHFTIGAFPPAEQYPAIQEIQTCLGKPLQEINGYTFQPNELVIYEIGPDGACVNIAKSFPL